MRRLLATWTLVMIGASWNLWTGRHALPKVPFLTSTGALFGEVGAIPVAVLCALIGMAGFSRRWRVWYGLSLLLLTALILGDQHRFQAWAYQYMMTGLFLCAAPAGNLGLARGWYASIYVHSGLSKLDASFNQEVGGLFLETLLRPVGLDPLGWPWLVRAIAIQTMPVGEGLVGFALAMPRWRRLGLFGVTILHGLLVGILGPFGLGHSHVVLLWNLAMLTECWVAFGGTGKSDATTTSTSWLRAIPFQAVFLAGVVLPLGERWGLFDAWPSHALYASHVERLFVECHETVIEVAPPSMRATSRAVEPGSDWYRIDMTLWSRLERGTPVYPQNRAGLGLAEGLAARYVEHGPVRVALFGQADRWTGRRPRTEIVGLDAIREEAGRYRLNGHPAPDSRMPVARDEKSQGRITPSSDAQGN